MIQSTRETRLSEPLSILLIEDSLADAALFTELLSHQSEQPWLVQHAMTLKTGIETLEKDKFDIVVLDLELPDSEGINTLKKIQNTNDELPLIVLTGNDDPQIGLEAVDNGAQDFLIKGELDSQVLSRRLYFSLRRQELMNQYQADSQHDALTSLPNRSLFMQALQKAISQTPDHPHSLFGVIFIDLDHFKQLNDTHGHTLGDQFLLEMASRLKKSIRGGDIAARIGGDEFCLLIHNLNDRLDILPVISRIQRNLSEIFCLRDLRLQPSSSMGVALSDFKFPSAEAMLDAADTAMYHAKTYVRGSYIICTPEMMQQQAHINKLDQDIKAIEPQSDLDILYQPMVSTDSGNIFSLYIQAKWKSQLGSQISPGELLHRAESNQMLRSFNQWLLPQALQQVGQWQKKSVRFHNLKLLLQLSLEEWLDEKMPDNLKAILQNQSFDNHTLYLGIHESHLTQPRQDLGLLIERMEQIKAQGFHIYLDNFGGGNLSVNTLKKLPLDLAKINLDLMDLWVDSSKKDQLLLKSLIDLSRFLELDILVSGVRDSEVYVYLKKLGCTYAMGTYFFHPMDAHELNLLF